MEAGKDSHGHSEGQDVTCAVQKPAGIQRQMSKEPKSFIDFLLSADCKISSGSKRAMVKYYTAEYDNRVQLLRRKMASVRGEMASAKTSLVQNMMMQIELCKKKSEVSLNEKRMKLREGELKEKQREQVLLHKRLQLLEGLQRIVDGR